MFDAVGKTCWTDKMQRCSAMQANPQQPIKTRKWSICVWDTKP